MEPWTLLHISVLIGTSPPSHHMHTAIYTSIPEGGVNVNTSALVEEGYYAAPKPMGKVTMADQCNSY